MNSNIHATFIKKLKNGFDRKNYFKSKGKFLNFWWKSTGNCSKIQANQDLKNDFHRVGKIRKPACKRMRVWTKNEENSEKISIKFQQFLIKISMENWLFSLNIVCMDSSPNSTGLSKITPVFYKKLSDFTGGSSRVPPPAATELRISVMFSYSGPGLFWAQNSKLILNACTIYRSVEFTQWCEWITECGSSLN